MIDTPPVYEPRYYERSAQRHMARHLQTRLFINVSWGLFGNLASRREIDAVALSERRATPIEIKAYELDAGEVDDIVTKYRALGFRQLFVVAPAFSSRAARSRAGNTLATELVVFRPLMSDGECTTA